MTSPELRSLLQGCKDAPDDDAPRLVLADWLEENGDADRAEFVRLSVRHSAGDVPLGDEAAALARLHELYSRNADAWLGGLRASGGRVCFRRGLIEVRSDPDDLRAIPGAAPAHALPWLEKLDFRYGQQKRLGELVKSDAVRHFSSLELLSVRLTAPWLEKLGDGLIGDRLRRLHLSLSKLGPQPPLGEALAKGEGFSGLRSLEFDEDISDGAVSALAAAPWLAGLSSFRARAFNKAMAALARSPHAPRLTRLYLNRVPFVRNGLRELVASPMLERIAELHLQDAGIGSSEVAAFADRDWPRLRDLSLYNNPLHESGIRALAKVNGFSALKRLDLDYTLMDVNGLRALLSCPWIGGLERLELNGNFDDEAARTVAASATLGGLRHLELRSETIGPAGLAALLSSTNLSALQTLFVTTKAPCDPAPITGGGLPALTALAVRGGKMTAAGVRALAPLAPRLRHLDLGQCGLDDAAVSALAAPAFAGLTSLDLSWNRGVGPFAAQTLAQGPFLKLARLNLRSCMLRDEGLRALLAPRAFPALTILDVANNSETTAGHARLLDWPQLPSLAWCQVMWYTASSPLPRPVAFPER